ncbi:MAG: ComEC/Rec2 family competence protein, partial [bacterium]
VCSTSFTWFTAWNWFFNLEVFVPYFLVWSGIFYLTIRFDRSHTLLNGFGFTSFPTAISGFLAAQFAIQLGMMWPLSAYYFLKYPLAGGYANLLAMPLVGVVVPLGIVAELAGLLPVIGDWLALVVNAGNYLAVAGFMWVSHLAADYIPYPAVREFELIHLIFLYGILSVLAWWETYLNCLKQFLYWVTDNIFHKLTVEPTVVLGWLVGIFVLVMTSLTCWQ